MTLEWLDDHIAYPSELLALTMAQTVIDDQLFITSPVIVAPQHRDRIWNPNTSLDRELANLVGPDGDVTDPELYGAIQELQRYYRHPGDLFAEFAVPSERPNCCYLGLDPCCDIIPMHNRRNPTRSIKWAVRPDDRVTDEIGSQYQYYHYGDLDDADIIPRAEPLQASDVIPATLFLPIFLGVQNLQIESLPSILILSSEYGFGPDEWTEPESPAAEPLQRYCLFGFTGREELRNGQVGNYVNIEGYCHLATYFVQQVEGNFVNHDCFEIYVRPQPKAKSARSVC